MGLGLRDGCCEGGVFGSRRSGRFGAGRGAIVVVAVFVAAVVHVQEAHANAADAAVALGIVGRVRMGRAEVGGLAAIALRAGKRVLVFVKIVVVAGGHCQLGESKGQWTYTP